MSLDLCRSSQGGLAGGRPVSDSPLADMALRVVHVALTPLAGSPIRIVSALNQHSGVRARLVVLNPGAYGSRTFDGDLDWQVEREAALEALRQADVVHCHHYFDLEQNPFQIDFRKCCRTDVRFVRQFHSTPLTIARGDDCSAKRIVESTIPQLVIAQYPERFYPRARVVPNLVPLADERYLPKPLSGAEIPTVFFSPSRDESAWSVVPGQTRWDTKGAPETEQMLLRLQARHGRFRVAVRRNLPHVDCLRERQASDLAIDELVTGSYHLTSLEALAQGLPTFAFLDGRTLDTLAELTGTQQHPWLNFRLEEAEGALVEFIKDSQLRREIGLYARSWMERYYDDRIMVQHYTRAYADLLERPELFERNRFDPGSRRAQFLAQRRDDLIWERRRALLSDKPAQPVRAECRHGAPNGTGPMPSWIQRPVHGLLRKYTSVRVDEITALEERVGDLERLLEFVAADESHRWLYQNRLERMDATLELFDRQRREFHLDRYRFAAQRVGAKRVLDCACGTGYGARMLCEMGGAASVIGVDLEPRAVAYARAHHGVAKAEFLCSSGDCLALPDAAVEVITSFETIEHVPDDAALLEEFYRVLRPNGMLIISTPNQWPLADAPFHVREYDRESFVRVLERRFDCLELYNQNSGSVTPFNHGQAAGVVPTTTANQDYAECFIAVCRRPVVG